MSESAISRRQSSELSFRRGTYFGAVIGGILTACFLAPMVDWENPKGVAKNTLETPASAEDTDDQTCPKREYERMQPSEIKTALEYSELTRYSSQLEGATSFEEAQKIMDEVFSRWEYTVKIGSVPVLDERLIETHGDSVEHTPELITQQLVNISSIHILETLTSMPESLLEATKGTDLYLTMGMVGEDGGYAGLYSKDAKGRPVMIVGIGPDDPSGRIFEHELGHNLFFRLCGDEIGYNDTELADLNPEAFYYTRKRVPGSHWEGITSSRYGATNTAEDTAEMFEDILQISVAERCFMNESFQDPDSPLCKKMDLLLQRIAAVDTAAATYFAS